MNQHINPTAREDVLPINDELEIRYSLLSMRPQLGIGGCVPRPK